MIPYVSLETAFPDAFMTSVDTFNFCSLRERESNVYSYQHVTCTNRELPFGTTIEVHRFSLFESEGHIPGHSMTDTWKSLIVTWFT